MEPRYNHLESEDKIYSLWEQSGFFNPDCLPKQSALSKAKGPHKKVSNFGFRASNFSIIMPPPNSNGSLHIGHALFVTLQDIMIRYHRMKGDKTLWLPGADHAGFETQVVYDKKLEKEERNRYEIPREKLYEEIWNFTQENKKIMEGQLKKLGASCDWSREKFTLDPDIVETVYATFKKLHDDGLIYRGRRIVNWCPKHQTSLSDLEISQPQTEDTLYYLQYGPFVIATARPETKFGDKYVVVHPKDKRYSKYKNGETFEFEWINGQIKTTLIKDEVIDMEFGTGAMTITPWHDAADFEIAERHKLPVEQIIDWQGKLLPIAGEFTEKHIKKARPQIVEKMEQKGLLVKTEKYTHAVPACYKCGTPIEPQIRPQWYVAMTKKPKLGGLSLRDAAVKAVKKSKVKIIPDHKTRVFLHWMKNLKDWNISRQIVWGIRIPAWYCAHATDNLQLITYNPNACHPIISVKTPEACPTCKSKSLVQDPDVFDTWFSSGQWPFAALGYPKGKDFETFYPTSVMETAADILFFWIARMLMLGIYRAGKIPFRTVYLHGLILDKDKQKMSKSKGNVIDPLGVAAEYGADAVRMALVAGNTPGRDSAISEDKIRGYRNFGTKLWNMARFIETHTNENPRPPFVALAKKGQYLRLSASKQDKEHIKGLNQIKAKVTKHLEKYEFHLALETAYHYVWHEFADKIIEEKKSILQNGAESEKEEALSLISSILYECLKMLHPFMPFITEEIYQHLRSLQIFKDSNIKGEDLLMVSPW